MTPTRKWHRSTLITLFAALFAWQLSAHPPKKDGDKKDEHADKKDDTATHATTDEKGAADFEKKIKPILEKQCVQCHRKGGQASRYGDYSKRTSIKRYAKRMCNEVTDERMPHGASLQPLPECGGTDRYDSPRLLTEEEKKAMCDWAKGGAGLPAADEKLPQLPKEEKKGEWAVGKPDVVLHHTKTGGFTIPPEGGGDIFRNFVIDTDAFKNSDRFIQALEIKPGHLAPASAKHPFPIVHHVHVFIDTTGTESTKLEAAYQAEWKKKTDNGKKKPEADRADVGEPKFWHKGEGWESRNTPQEFKLIGSWFPGSGPLTFPPGIAQKVPKGAKLVVQMHYTAYNEEDVKDDTQIGIQFAKAPVENPRELEEAVNEDRPQDLRKKMGETVVEGFPIPAGAKKHVVRTQLKITEDLEVGAITPHCHQICTSQQIMVTPPNGGQKCLLKLKWDFEHQLTHSLTKPMKFPKGTVFDQICTYDNSADNPRQFNKPPKAIPWGPIAEQEMCRVDYAGTRPGGKMKVASPKMTDFSVAKGKLTITGTGVTPGAEIEVDGVLCRCDVADGKVTSRDNSWVKSLSGKTAKIAVVNPDGGRTETREVAVADLMK